MTTPHTPTPWEVDDDYGIRSHVGAAVARAMDGDDFPCLDSEESIERANAEGIANAALIVRAVNMHDALVALLPGLLRAQDFVDKCDHLHDCARMQRKPRPCDCYAEDATHTLGKIVKLLKAETP